MARDTSPEPPHPIGVAVLGLGPWGRNLVRAFDATPGCHVVAIGDPDPGRLAACTDAPTAWRSADSTAVIEAQDVRAVVIAAPAHLHVPLAELALGHGKHAFVEKPMSLTVAGAEHLVRLAAERGLRLMVGHVLEHHPAVAALEALISEDQLGRIERVASFRFGPAPSREEGAWWSLAPHDVGLALRFIQAPARSVQVARTTAGQAERVTAVIQFDGGQSAELHVGTRHSLKIRRTLVFGSRATAELDDCQPDGKLRLLRQAASWPEDVPSTPIGGEVVPCSPRAPLAQEAEAFIRAIRDGAAVPGDGVSGLGVTRVLAAGQRAMESGRAEPIGTAPAPPAPTLRAEV